MTAARWCIAAVVVACLLGGCSRRQSLTCEERARYATAESAPPVRIPDDLSPPDESDSLQLPPEAAVPPLAADQPCLETPPSFTSRPTAPSNAAPPPGAEAPPASPAAGGDREISN